MAANSLTPADYHLLNYFSVVAEEGSMQKAAIRLCISQPPLSRQIKRLEELLGITLFVRHSKGLTLTPDGAKVLALIQPLIAIQKEVYGELGRLGCSDKNYLTIGLTTAFEQGSFAKIKAKIASCTELPVHYRRMPSPKLVRSVQKGLIDIAFVALPLDTEGLVCRRTAYGEPMMAVLPGSWPESGLDALDLSMMTGKPLFWFKREQNCAFFDHMKKIFFHTGFAPLYLDEPPEHDVLLARIADGEAMTLLPASFASIQRENVSFVSIAQKGLFVIEIGILFKEEQDNIKKIIDFMALN